MIQLYVKGNENFAANGDYILQPVSCELDRQINGLWELTMEYPAVFELKENAFSAITTEAVLKVPTPEGNKLFRIYDVQKESGTTMLAYARPIFFDAAGEVFFVDTRIVNKNGQDALDILTSGTRYSGRSDIAKVSTAYYERKNLLEALSGDLNQSFLNRWGGEVLYDDLTVVINERIGGDYGAEIRYGKNLKEIEEKTSVEDVVTRIVPVAYNGYMLGGDTPWVDSPLINKYARIHTKEIKYEDVKLQEDVSGDEETGFANLNDLRAELRRRCEQEFEAGIDKPTVNQKVNMVDLAQTVEYADYKELEQVSLGDTVHCVHYKLEIDTKARVIRQVWDCITQKNITLEIGDFKGDYFNYLTNVSGMVNSVFDKKTGNLMAERISGFLDGMLTQFRIQNTAAKKQEVRAILFEDLDPDSSMYGALCIGTQGFQIASERTEDGRDWKWETAANSKGIVADMILAGILADKTGNNYWNLDTGDFRLSSNTQVGDTTLGDIVKAVEKAGSVMISLSNDNQIISVNSDGDYGAFPSDVSTRATVTYGIQDITNECEFKVIESGLTGNWNAATKTYTVTDLIEDEGYVEIRATYLKNLTVAKRFTVTKMQGVAGRTYFIEASATVVKRSMNNTTLPNVIEFTSYYRDGANTARIPYKGRFIVEETIDGEKWVTTYSSKEDESMVTHYLYSILTDVSGAAITNAAGDVLAFPRNVAGVRCKLYAAGGMDTLMDIQSVAVVVDVDNLTALQVLDILSQGWQGIYSANGKYYLSFAAARGGVLALGGRDYGDGEIQVYNDTGEQIGHWTKNGFKATNANIEGRITAQSGNIAGFDLGADFLQYSNDGYTGYIGKVYRNQEGKGIFIRLRDEQNKKDIILITKDGKASFSLNGTYADHTVGIDGPGGALINEIYTYNQVSIVSDERFKENIKVNEKDAMDILNNIELYDFDWIESGEHEQCAFVAQQLKEVDPSFVSDVGKDHILMIKSGKIIPYLVKALKQLDARVRKVEGTSTAVSDKSKWKPQKIDKEEKKRILREIRKNQRKNKIDEEDSIWDFLE